MADSSRFKELLKRFEGYSEKPYTDAKGNPTIGIGTNLNSPEVSQILQNMGYDVGKVKTGEQPLTPEELDRLANEQIMEKDRYLQTIQKSDFPNYSPKENELNALRSLMYHSPKMIGPEMRKKLDANDRFGAFNEIVGRSNKNKEAGVQFRRLQEAEEFAGEQAPEYFDRLPASDVESMRQILDQTQDPSHLEEIKKKFPKIWQK